MSRVQSASQGNSIPLGNVSVAPNEHICDNETCDLQGKFCLKCLDVSSSEGLLDFGV